jgi:hypothetical protein
MVQFEMNQDSTEDRAAAAIKLSQYEQMQEYNPKEKSPCGGRIGK